MSPRRTYRRLGSIPPLDPEAFARRIALKVRTEYGNQLLGRALSIVERTGSPDPWIRAVRRVRDAGGMSAALARFLIVQVVEHTITWLMYNEPRLAVITARIDAIERAHGLREDQFWRVDEGPIEWQELNREWDQTADELAAEILARNGEPDVMSGNLGAEDTLFEEGRELFVGDRDPDDGAFDELN